MSVVLNGKGCDRCLDLVLQGYARRIQLPVAEETYGDFQCRAFDLRCIQIGTGIETGTLFRATDQEHRNGT